MAGGGAALRLARRGPVQHFFQDLVTRPQRHGPAFAQNQNLLDGGKRTWPVGNHHHRSAPLHGNADGTVKCGFAFRIKV